MFIDPRRRELQDSLARLLEHPAIWRGGSAARAVTIPTGFGALDERLPGRGWPMTGLVEVLVHRLGIGELYLLMPALAALTQRPSARWCAWVAPPLEPFAPALAAHGLALERVLVVRTAAPLWAFEQATGSGACEVVLSWVRHLHPRDIRRLQLACERGRTLGVLFRSRRAARDPSSAILRIALEPLEEGARITLLKSRGGLHGSVDLSWHEPVVSREGLWHHA